MFPYEDSEILSVRTLVNTRKIWLEIKKKNPTKGFLIVFGCMLDR